MSAAGCEQQGTGWGILEGLPGDPMIWVLIFSEFAAFGLFLGALRRRPRDPSGGVRGGAGHA